MQVTRNRVLGRCRTLTDEEVAARSERLQFGGRACIARKDNGFPCGLEAKVKCTRGVLGWGGDDLQVVKVQVLHGIQGTLGNGCGPGACLNPPAVDGFKPGEKVVEACARKNWVIPLSRRRSNFHREQQGHKVTGMVRVAMGVKASIQMPRIDSGFRTPLDGPTPSVDKKVTCSDSH